MLPKRPFHNPPNVASPLSKQLQPEPPQHSIPSANLLRSTQHQQQQQQYQQLHQQQQLQQLQQQQEQQTLEKSSFRSPGLSLDTSGERLQNATIVHHNNKQYLKLFSPGLVESPVSFLDQKQLVEDEKLWENGPDAAFQKQLESDRHKAIRVRSRQQLRGFFMGLWLGCLLGGLLFHQTSTNAYFSGRPVRQGSSFTTLILLLAVFLSCVAVVRSGTRCLITTMATCIAVLTCFATVIANQSRNQRYLAKASTLSTSSHHILINSQH
ncbi:hypothetical protein BGZ94_003206 [Podila epigama]|nr:hypothetical protein BGZ94_003206 [Podila epigama]